MTAASVLGVAITRPLAAACRELLAGVASREAWQELAPLVAESERYAWDLSPEGTSSIWTGDGYATSTAGGRYPPFGEPWVVEMPPLHALAMCALGSACARCTWQIESSSPEHGEPLEDGWCCAACVVRQRAREAFRKRAALWLRRGNQMGLFGAEPAGPRRRRR